MAKFDIHSQKLKSTDTMNVLIPTKEYIVRRHGEPFKFLFLPKIGKLESSFLVKNYFLGLAVLVYFGFGTKRVSPWLLSTVSLIPTVHYLLLFLLILTQVCIAQLAIPN